MLAFCLFGTTPVASAADGAPPSRAVDVVATTAPGLTVARLSSDKAQDWARLSVQVETKTLALVLRCVNAGPCAFWEDQTRVGDATLERADQGFVARGTVRSGGASTTVRATWNPEKALAEAIVRP